MYKPILRFNGSTNTVESYLPKPKTLMLTVLQRSTVSRSLAKIYAFDFAAMLGFPCLNMKLRLTIIVKICQKACACIFHILAEHWFLISAFYSLR